MPRAKPTATPRRDSSRAGICECGADDAAIAGVAPVTHAHVNTLERYDLSRQPPISGLRPLRRVDQDLERGVPTPPLGVNGDKH